VRAADSFCAATATTTAANAVIHPVWVIARTFPSRAAASHDRVPLPPAFIELRPNREVELPGQALAVDVYLRGATNLRAYQVALKVSGERSGHVALEDPWIDGNPKPFYLGRARLLMPSIGMAGVRGRSLWPVVSMQPDRCIWARSGSSRRVMAPADLSSRPRLPGKAFCGIRLAVIFRLSRRR